MANDRGSALMLIACSARHVLLVALLPLLSSCLKYKEVAFQDIHGVELEDMDAQSVHLRASVRLSNPNGYRIHVKDPDMDLYLNGKFVGKGILDSALVLERKSDRDYSIPLHAEFQGANLLMMMLSGALSGSVMVGVKGTVLGQAGLLRKRFPFELEEKIDLYK